ncbi:hypothetical protein ACWDV4_13975 [Micromonospora sp. NPDC003197]
MSLVMCVVIGTLGWFYRTAKDRAASSVDPALVEQVAAENELVQAASTLLNTAGVSYQGWFDYDRGRVELDARVTNQGWTAARLTVDGQRIEALDTGERTFVKANASFWRSSGTTAQTTAEYANRWVKVPDEMFGFDLGNVLAPALLAESIAPGISDDGMAGENAEPVRGPPRTVDGIAVIPVSAAGAVYDITRDEPKRIVRISTASSALLPSGTFRGTGLNGRRTGLLLAALRDEDDGLELRLTELSPTELRQFVTELNAHVTDLKNSIDSEINFSLSGAVTLAPCTTNGCTANLTIKNTVSPTSKHSSPYVSVTRPVQARVTVRMTLDGRPVATCVSTLTMKPNGSSRVTCRANYYIPPARNPKVHTVRAAATAVAQAVVDADIAQLAKDLANQLIRNRTAGPRTGHEYFPKGQPPTLNARQQAARDRVDQLAKRACREVRRLPNEDEKTWGDRVHRRFAMMIKNEPAASQLFSEVGYLNGRLSRIWRNEVTGRQGWLRDTKVPDVVFGADRLRPELFLDLKTGSLGLEEDWYNKLVANLPQNYKNVPVVAVRC